MRLSPAPLLVLGVGNPSRGDDALGPLFIERAAEALKERVAAGELELLTDFQLQIEHALDLEGRGRVVFVDASLEAAPPFHYAPVAADPAPLPSTHAMSPGQVLAAYRQLRGETPEAWLLAIRGEHFELGAPLSPAAAGHLSEALRFLLTDI
jgi:hydrogenase maturation protease